MPLYEYQCQKCGKVFEIIQKFSAEPLSVHEDCGGAVERLLSAPAIQFKGTGWYVTDYARRGSGSGSGKDEPKGKDDKNGAKTETKSDSKSDTKSGGDSGKPSSSDSSSSTTSSSPPASTGNKS